MSKFTIIGTAGHVDHGKTSLIKALSGIETDRFEEEKKRGITIDLGFANLKDEEGNILGIIDVPGHEKFVSNMLAGIGGIDIVILVIAADEGFMPQTREHFNILKSLGISHGLIALTKIDLVEESEWIELLKEEIREEVSGSFLEEAPIFEVSTKTGENIDQLKNELFKLSKDIQDKSIKPEDFRLPIDRVFSVHGHGTVITGTLIEGSVRVGDRIMIYPLESEVSVRNIQVHDQDVKAAFAGQRTAINLSKISVDEIKRGHILAAKNSMLTSQMIDCTFKVFDDAKFSVLHQSRVHFHAASDQRLAKVILFDKNEILPGENAYAQLRFDEPISLKKNDPFILRFFSPIESIAGGQVLDPRAKKHKASESVISSLEILENGSPLQQLLDLLRRESKYFLSTEECSKRLGFSVQDVINESSDIIQIQVMLFDTDTIQSFVTKVKEIFKSYYLDHPLEEGMLIESLRSILMKKLRASNEQADALIQYFVEHKILSMKDGSLDVFDSPHTIPEEELKIAKALLEELEMDEFSPRDTKPKNIGYLNVLLRQNLVVRLDANVFLPSSKYNQAIDVAKHIYEELGKIELSVFRDKINTSRKYALLILESFDQNGITKKEGDFRFFTKI